MDLKETIARLSAAKAPSGREFEAAELAAKLLSPYVDSVATDRLSNVIGTKSCGKPGAKRLLLDAHLDEIGLIITGQEEGFLRFRSVYDSADPRMLPGRQVHILADEPLFGVVTCLPPHIQTAAEQDKAFPADELFIDAGLSEEEAKGIPIGTPAVFDSRCTELSGGCLCGKSFDDRCCFAALLLCLEKLTGVDLNVDLIILGSVQEEAGLLGAKSGAFSAAPDFAVAVDVTHAASPDAAKTETFKLGGGAVIGVGPNMAPWMSARMKKLAEDNAIDYQLEIMERGSGTNAWSMQISREGVATMVLSVPLRYMHSPVEVIKLTDVEAVASLLAEFCKSFVLGEVPQCWSL